ncbi:ArdC-like ssDNA-binding domain-containing protein [Leifsonia xyli]|uniref:ArdC-like ssDNA-binding domain-containing protein n=1 Tax=Leifsonia xyli TaxID=1575 RepID=UPI0002F65CB3|nr:ArdC family protein [Leifsonia xyli]
MAKTITKRTPEERKAQAEALHATLTDQVQQLTDSDQWRRLLDFTRSFHTYSLNNLLLILSQCPDASAVAGFRQWQAKGRQVRKGEKSIKIFGYSTKKITQEDPDTGEEVEKRAARFPMLSVFDISQTDPIDGAEILDPRSRN